MQWELWEVIFVALFGVVLGYRCSNVRQRKSAASPETSNSSLSPDDTSVKTKIDTTMETKSFYHRVCLFEPRNNGDPLRDMLGQFLLAKSSIDIATYLFSGNQFETSLEAAVKRGVIVRLVLDANKPDSFPTELKKRGIQIRCFQVPEDSRRCGGSRVPWKIFHQKFILIDNEILLFGSCNMTEASFSRHYENIVTTNDPRFVQPFQAEFQERWKEFPPYRQAR